jgi:hypothetical protein
MDDSEYYQYAKATNHPKPSFNRTGNGMTKTKLESLLVAAFALMFLTALNASAQAGLESTRFVIHGAPILIEPTGEFRHNLSNGFGGIGGLLYQIDRPGFFGLLFDVSAQEYGRESKQVPFSDFVDRVFIKQTTANSIITLSFGPEVAWPHGRLRPYFNTGVSELFFRTTSSVHGIDSSEDNIASTTNFRDNTHGWFLGGGLRVPLLGDNPQKAISLDLGVRYLRGGEASYLREGSIQDNPNGKISFTPLTSLTPHVIYLVGVRFRIPHDPAKRCARLLC